jgi:hypothetical protein
MQNGKMTITSSVMPHPTCMSAAAFKSMHRTMQVAHSNLLLRDTGKNWSSNTGIADDTPIEKHQRGGISVPASAAPCSSPTTSTTVLQQFNCANCVVQLSSN